MTSPISKRIGKNLVAGFSAMTLALGTVTTGYAVTTPAVTNFFSQGLSGQLLDLWATGNDIGTIAILDNFQITGGASGVYSGTFVTHELVSSASAVNLASEVAAIAQQYADAASAINATYSLNLDFTTTDFTSWFNSASGVYSASAVAAVEGWFTGYANAMSAVMGAYSMNSFLPQWVPVSAATSTFPDYILTDSGWVNGLMQPPKTIVDNGNGTVTVTELKKGTYTMTVSEHVLDGLPIMDPYFNNAPIPGAYYPAGSRQFSGTGGVYSKDSYLIWGSAQPADWWIVKDMQGNAFTALPNIGADSFCADSTVFTPISGVPATGADNYNAFWAWDCTVDGIASRSTAPDFTIRLSAKDTGYSAYPVEIFNANTTTSGSWLNNRIIGVVNGFAQMGQFKPAGTLIKDGLFFRNPIATNAEFKAVASAHYGTIDISSMVLPASWAVTATSGTSSTTTVSTTTTSTIQATTVPLNIVPGWNLLGNSNNVPLDVALNFGDSSKVTTVWKWNSVSSKWAFYSPTFNDGGAAYATAKGYEFLTTINGGEGFWVNSKISFSSILPAGIAVTTSNFQDSLQGLNPLPSGWSLIAVAGYPTPVAFNNGLSSTPPATGTTAENLTTLWAWDNARGSWYFYAPSLDKAGTMNNYITSKKYLNFASGVLTPTTGFWVNRPASAGAPGYTTTTTATTSTTTVGSTTTTTVLNTTAAQGIQSAMTAFQSLYASAIPAAADVGALFDASFLMDGMNKADTLLAFTTNGNGPTVGMQFVNITLVSPVDAGAVPNDASHQWFTFDVTGGGGGPMEPWLAIKNLTGNWLIAGNQRLFGVTTEARNEKHVPSASRLLAGDQPTYSSNLDISVKQDNNRLSTFSKILVNGPGLVPANGNAGVLLYSKSTGSNWVQACNSNNLITTNCYDLTQVTAGAQYTFTAYVQSGSVSVPAASYVSVLHALPLSQSSLTAAMFPDVTNVTSSWAPGSSVTVDWTLPTGLTGNWIDISGWGNTAGNVFNLSQNMSGTSATFTIPNYTGTLSGIGVWASASDANGNQMATSVNVDPPVAAMPTAPELGLHTAAGVYSFAPATGVLSFNLTHSDFICDGIPATAGTMAVTLLDVTSMTLEGTDVWTRSGGTAGDIAGTWSFTDSVSGNTFTMNLDSAGNMSLGGNIVACPTGSTVTAPSALSNYLAEGSSYAIFPAVGDWPAGLDTLTATPTASAGNYSHQLNYVTFANNAWSAPVTPRIWVGPAAGWVVGGGAQADFTVNADGTITATDLAGNVMNFTLTETDLSGTPITNCPSGSCGTYPTGAKSYSSNAVAFTKDRYKIHVETKVTDLAGNQLTAFPGLTTSFCADDYGIFRPISVAVTGDNNYEVVPFPAGVLCNAASIPLYQAASAVGTVLLQEIAATATNPNVIVASNASNTAAGYLNSVLIAVFNGKAIDGQIKRAGSNYIFMNGYLNSIAANAELAANGMPLLGQATVVSSAINNYLAEGTSYWVSPSYGGWPAGLEIMTVTPSSTGVYSHSLNYQDLVNNAWSTGQVPRVWNAASGSWLVGGGGDASFVLNSNGSITATDLAGNVMTVFLTETDLTGTSITNCPATNTSGTCGTYPAGSKSYSSTPVTYTKDRYRMWTDSFVTDASGTQLITLPSLSTLFCSNDFSIFRPISGATTGANNYEVILFPNGEKCNATSIAQYQNATADGTVLLQELVATATNPNVLVSSAATGFASNNVLIALVEGKVISGSLKKAGTSYTFMNGYLNSIAANAELSANGMPLLNAIQAIQMGGAIQGADLNLSGVVTTLAMSGVVPTGSKAVTTDGVNLYIADTLNQTIKKVDIATGQSAILAGSSGITGNTNGTGSAAMFNYPEDIATDGNNLYVSDRSNCTIRQIVIATGVVSTLAGSGSCGNADGIGAGASFYYPMGITTDGINVFVADGNHKIRQIVIATGVVTSLAGGANNIPGCSPNPCGSADGVGAAAGFTSPDGLTTDGINVYVVDAGNYKIRQIDIATGTVSTIAGGAGGGASYCVARGCGATDGIGAAASFTSPTGITTDGTNLFVVDKGNSKIRKIVISSGLVSTLAGSGATTVTDGTGAAASFGNPWRITSDGSKLYVVDLPSIRIIQ